MTQKLKAIIVDDEDNCIEVLAFLLKRKCPDVEVIATYNSPQEAALEIPTLDADVLFLDIDMPGMNGFTLLDKIKPTELHVIFTTAYNEFAIKAFKVNAVDYMLKPVDATELEAAIEKVRKAQATGKDSVAIENLLKHLQSTTQKSKIAVATDEGLIMIPYDEIIYMKAEGAYTEIFHGTDTRTVTIKSLGEFETQLTKLGFYRIHNSYIVNLNKINKYVKDDGGYVVMSNGVTVSISRRKKDEFLKALG